VASPRPFLELSVAEWLDELAGPRATPAGGSAAALAVAMAAAVLTMTARVSKETWDAGGAAAAQAETLRARATPLAQLDAELYEQALAARDAAADLPPERRDWQIGDAFARAAEPPLEIARTAADVAELAAEIADRGDPRARADAQAAAALAAAGARAAAALVAVNLTAVEGDPRVAEAGRLAQAAEESSARARAASR
jgi:formiminotetrahydrofolate cyclodeaminase